MVNEDPKSLEKSLLKLKREGKYYKFSGVLQEKGFIIIFTKILFDKKNCNSF